MRLYLSSIAGFLALTTAQKWHNTTFVPRAIDSNDSSSTSSTSSNYTIAQSSYNASTTSEASSTAATSGILTSAPQSTTTSDGTVSPSASLGSLLSQPTTAASLEQIPNSTVLGNTSTDSKPFATGSGQAVTSSPVASGNTSVGRNASVDCQAALLSWSSALSSFGLETTDTYYSYVDHTVSYGSARNVTMVNGIPHAKHLPEITSTSVYAALHSRLDPHWTVPPERSALMTEPRPTCTIDSSSCSAVWAEYGSSVGLSSGTTSINVPLTQTMSNYPQCQITGPDAVCLTRRAQVPGLSCVVHADDVQVFFWPSHTQTQHATITSPPQSIITDGITMYSPTVYLSFDKISILSAGVEWYDCQNGTSSYWNFFQTTLAAAHTRYWVSALPESLSTFEKQFWQWDVPQTDVGIFSSMDPSNAGGTSMVEFPDAAITAMLKPNATDYEFWANAIYSANTGHVTRPLTLEHLTQPDPRAYYLNPSFRETRYGYGCNPQGPHPNCGTIFDDYYKAAFSIPPEVLTLYPEFTSCNVFEWGSYDPPVALTQIASPDAATTSTSGPITTPPSPSIALANPTVSATQATTFFPAFTLDVNGATTSNVIAQPAILQPSSTTDLKPAFTLDVSETSSVSAVLEILQPSPAAPTTTLKPIFTLDVLTQPFPSAIPVIVSVVSAAILPNVLIQQSADPANSPQASTQHLQDPSAASAVHNDGSGNFADSLTVVPTTLTSFITSSSSGSQVVIPTTVVSGVTVEKATGVISVTFVPTTIASSFTTTISNSLFVLSTQITSSVAVKQVNGQLISQAVVPTTVTSLLTTTSSGIEIVVPTTIVSSATIRMANGQLISETVLPTTVTGFVTTTNQAVSIVTLPTTIISSVTVAKAVEQIRVQQSMNGIGASGAALQSIVGGAASLATSQHPDGINPASNGAILSSGADTFASGHSADIIGLRPANAPLVGASTLSSGHTDTQNSIVVFVDQHGSTVTVRASSVVNTHSAVQAAASTSTGLGGYIVAGIQPGVQPGVQSGVQSGSQSGSKPDISQASAALPPYTAAATQTTLSGVLSTISAVLLAWCLAIAAWQVLG